jgi:feruloyl-CoA synthase
VNIGTVDRALEPAQAAPFRDVNFMPVDLDVAEHPDGTILLRTKLPMPEYDPNIPRALAATAAREGDKTALAIRNAAGVWEHISYAQFKRDLDAVTQWLMDNVPCGTAILLIGPNTPAYATLTFAAFAAGVIVCPVGMASLLSAAGEARLRHVLARAKPSAVFADGPSAIQDLIARVLDPVVQIIAPEPTTYPGGAIAWADVVGTIATPDVERAIDNLDTSLPASYMMTSGSTGLPKLVATSLDNIAAVTIQGSVIFGPEVYQGSIVDWLPWHHAAGAGILRTALFNGGSLFIDVGKPMPALFDETIRNLREIPVPYFANVPQGFAMLVDAMEQDDLLRRSFFQELRLMLYGGAGLPQPVYDRLQAMAVAETGHRIHMSSGYGMTETVTGCIAIHFPTDRVGIGLPPPGIEVKLVPNGSRYEVRLRGPNVMLGYVDEPEQTANAFDAEGYYRTGDLANFHDRARPGEGLYFAGRLAEEFKLLTGSWVYGGQVRDAVLEKLDGDVSELVLCGENREYLAVMAWPKVPEDGNLLARITDKLKRYNDAGGGASVAIRRVVLLTSPPNPVAGEVSDKGTINRRAVLTNRADVLEQLYAADPASDIGIVRGN